jgi:CHAT domain-containing protein/tetratricopeptide (TPR) repeat protein
MDPRIEQVKRLIQAVDALHSQDRSAEAVTVANEAVAIARSMFGPRSPDAAGVLNILAGLHRDAGERGAAEAMYGEALDIDREVLGPRHPEVAAILSNRALLHRQAGEFEEAARLYEEALEIYRHVSATGADVALTLSALGSLHQDMGDYPRAERLHREALEIYSSALGDRNPRVAASLNNLAEVHRASGAYAAADPLYRRALEILRQEHGARHPSVATILNNTAMLRAATGDFRAAERFFREALEILRETVGPLDPHVAATLNNLAELYRVTGEYGTAEPLLEEALSIRRRTLGPQHPDVGQSLNNLALILHARKDYGRAQGLYRRALEVGRRASGPRHPDVGQALNNLATLLHDRGDQAEAEPLYLEALEIKRQALGRSHPEVALALNNLAVLYAGMDRDEEALGLMEEAAGSDDRLLRDAFSIGSERQRLAFVAILEGATNGFLSLVLDRFGNRPDVVGKALDLVLRRKALAAEALAAQRDAVLSGRYPDLEAKLEALSRLRMRIARKTLAGPGSDSPVEHEATLEAWQAQRERLEAELAQAIPEVGIEERLRKADLDAVARALPSGGLLVEFIRFEQLDFRAVPVRGETRWKPPRYMAFILAAGEPEAVRMVDLGEADPIDRLIAEYREAITGSDREEPRGPGPAPARLERAERETGAGLRLALFDPLHEALAEGARLFLAPDGDLTRLPFEVLPTDAGGRLIDQYILSYLTTGRDLLRFGQQAVRGEPLIAAAPDFDLGGSPADQRPYSRRSRDLDPSRIHFGPLAGTGREGADVAAVVGGTLWMGDAVLEAHLKATGSPWILHLATHGFFLSDQHRSRADSLLGPVPVWEDDSPRGGGVENPLLRSGLALAGANTFLRGEPLPAEAEDGIITAEDVSGLDLLGTELVVLSACETGLGEVRVGEGVLGLRRAFVLAGARTLVMSLWKVPDGPTAELMQLFYGNLRSGMGRAEALRKAQLDLVKVYPPPLFWGAFICQGDPGPLEVAVQG